MACRPNILREVRMTPEGAAMPAASSGGARGLTNIKGVIGHYFWTESLHLATLLFARPTGMSGLPMPEGLRRDPSETTAALVWVPWLRPITPLATRIVNAKVAVFRLLP